MSNQLIYLMAVRMHAGKPHGLCSDWGNGGN